MLSKRAIEAQIEHYKTCKGGDAATNAIWIEALKWVLGPRSDHGEYYRFIETLKESARESDSERVPGDASPERLRIELRLSQARLATTRMALLMALERLR